MSAADVARNARLAHDAKVAPGPVVKRCVCGCGEYAWWGLNGSWFATRCRPAAWSRPYDAAPVATDQGRLL